MRAISIFPLEFDAIWKASSMSEKMAVLAPMPNASEKTATNVNIGARVGADVLFEHGADAVIRYRNRLLDRYATDSYTTVLSAIVATMQQAVLFAFVASLGVIVYVVSLGGKDPPSFRALAAAENPSIPSTPSPAA